MLSIYVGRRVGGHSGQAEREPEILFIYLFILMAASVAYGGSQAKCRIGAAAANLHHSHSNASSEPHL